VVGIACNAAEAFFPLHGISFKSQRELLRRTEDTNSAMCWRLVMRPARCERMVGDLMTLFEARR
jgi:hypothetical protein